MGTNYYDTILFGTAEDDLGISLDRAQPSLFVTPTTTYAQYKTAVGLAYDGSPPLVQKLVDYHMSALTEVVSSGVTTDPDYWSAGTVDGNYIINSGITHTKVGINTIVPNHELSVSGTVSASSSIYASTIYSGSTNLADILITLSADSGTVTSVAISGSDGIDVDSGSPITDSGTIALGLSNVDATKIADGTVTDTEFQYINTLSSNAQTQLTNKLDLAGGTMDGAIAMATNKITGLGDPTSAQDAATKAYADSLDHSSYWSAGTVDGNYIINSGITHAKVGINTIVPNHELSVSGTVSASSFLYASTVDTTNLKIAGAQGSDGQVLTSTGSGVAWENAGGSTDVYWSAGTVDGNYIINSGITHAKVGINTIVPNHELSVSGTISASTSIFVGSDCIFKSPESGSVFIGDDAGSRWEVNSTSNTAVGRLAMGTGTMSTAIGNTAIGFASISNITTGDRNTAVGLQSNTSNDTGGWNTTVGYTAMFANTYHSYNTALGANTLYFTTSGDLGKTVPTDTHNTAIGYSSQYYNLNGAYNTSVGSQAIGNGGISFAGTGNTAMGFKAMFNSQIGSYNTALGYQAGDNVTTGDYNINIGSDVDADSATGDYQLNIGDTIIGKDLVGDNLSINAVGIGTAVTSSLLTHTLTVSGDTLINDDLTVTGTLVVTGNTTLNGTLSATTSLNVGNGDGTISANTVQGSYQFITFLGNPGGLSNDDWAIPGTNGISNHTWNGDGGADGTTTGSSTLSIGRTIQHSFIRIPAGARLVGLEGVLRSNTNDQAYAGLFTFLPDYEGPDAAEATLRILAQTPSSSNNVTNDPQSFRIMAAEGDQHEFADGECIIPAIRRDSSSTQTVITNFTIILKY